MVLGLSFILLLERGPGREHIAIQSYMLALVAALGALYALALAVPFLRDFFELTQLAGGQLFLALLSAAAGWCWRASSGGCRRSSSWRSARRPPSKAPHGPVTAPTAEQPGA